MPLSAPVQLSEEVAKERLIEMIPADKLGPEEVDDFLERSKRYDSAGRAPTDSSWTPTWLLEYGAWKAWERRANALAEETTFVGDGRAQASDYSWLNAVRLRDYYKSLLDPLADTQTGISQSAQQLPGSVVINTKLSW